LFISDIERSWNQGHEGSRARREYQRPNRSRSHGLKARRAAVSASSRDPFKRHRRKKIAIAGMFHARTVLLARRRDDRWFYEKFSCTVNRPACVVSYVL